MTEPITIREEQPDDISAIHRLNVAAFGQPQEAELVDLLRTNGAALLSLVATLNGRVVGHILYSPATVEMDDRNIVGAGLAPMAVLPEYQRRGIGSRLVEAGTVRLRERGCPFIIVLGHPDYYPRFGFRSAREYGIGCQWEVPDNVFMVLVLDEAKMKGVSGLARYRDEFSGVV